MAALPHDETRHDVHAEVDEPSASLAWRILTSPRMFGVLAATMAVLLMVAALIPQRASVQELAHTLPFAFASAVHDLGLDDVLVSWPFLLVVLLMVLNLSGLWLASRLGAPHASLFATRAEAQVETSVGELEGRLFAAMGGRVAVVKDGDTVVATRGFVREGLVVVGIGVATLLAALAVSRGSGLDGRLALIPNATTLPESTVRDGDLMLLRQLPLGLFCGRPDPQDPSRTFPCRAAHAGSAPVTVALTPGQTSHVGAFSLTPLTESLRVPRDTDPLDAVLYRDGAIERLSLQPGTTVELKRGGERVTALPGPDGPLVVLQGVVDGKPSASLLMPSNVSAASAAANLRIEIEHPTTVTIAATTSPEWPLVLAGLGLVVLGLLLAAALPHVEVVLCSPTAARPAAGPRHSGPERASDTTSSGASIEVQSLNRKALVSRTLAALTQGAAPSSGASWLGAVRADLWGSVLTLVLAGVGVVLGALAAPTTPAVALALGAFVALGTRAAPILAAVAFVAGLGTTPDPALPGLFDLFAVVATGLGLGVLGRWLAVDSVVAQSPLVLAGLCALALGLLHLLPAPSIQLATAAGDPLVATATLADGASAMRVQWPVAMFSEGRSSVLAPLLWLGVLVAVALFAWHQRPHDTRRRVVAQAAAVFGAVAVVAGVLGLFQLLGAGSTEADVLRHRLDLTALGATALDVPATSWELRLWSRPFLDGLTVLLGLGVILKVWPAAQARSVTATTHTAEPANILLGAACLALVGFLLAVAHGVGQGALLGIGAAVLTVGALVSQRDVRAQLMTRLLLVGAAALSVAVWLVPVVT